LLVTVEIVTVEIVTDFYCPGLDCPGFDCPDFVGTPKTFSVPTGVANRKCAKVNHVPTKTDYRNDASVLNTDPIFIVRNIYNWCTKRNDCKKRPRMIQCGPVFVSVDYYGLLKETIISSLKFKIANGGSTAT